MSMQLVLSVNTSADGKTLADWFRWCWIGADGSPQADTAATGNRDDLRAALGERVGQNQATWLILPGSSVNTRELEYSEKEKNICATCCPFSSKIAWWAMLKICTSHLVRLPMAAW